MTTNNQFRFDPFTGEFFPILTTEIHQVKFFDDWNGYGIQLAEGVFLENPSSVSIVETATGGATYTEVPKSSTPGTLQFQVDYSADGYFGSSRVKFNATQVGKTVSVTYKGLGLLTSLDNYNTFLGLEEVFAVFGRAEFRGNTRVNLTANLTLRGAGNETLDCSLASYFRKTGGTGTITLSNIAEGQTVYVLMESTGSAYTSTWAGYTFRWQFATIPTPTATASRFDLYSFMRLNGIIYAGCSLQHG